MAATLDDLVFTAAALRIDVRSGLDKVVDLLEHPKPGPTPPGAGGGGGKGGGAGAGDYLDQIWAWMKKIANGGGLVQDALQAVYEVMAKIASPVTNAVSIMGKMQSATVATFDKLGSSAARAGQVLSSFGDTFTKVLGSLGGGLTKFVQLADPGAVYRFNWAMENAMSAFGRIFAPVLERFTALIQSLGNAVESLSPQAKRLIAGLGMGAGLAGAFAAVAAAVSMAVAALGGPVTLLITLAAAVLGVAAASADGKKMMAAFGGVLKLVGGAFEQLAGELLPLINELMPPVMAILSAMLQASLAVSGVILSVLVVVIKNVLVPILEGLAWVITKVAEFVVGAVNRIRKALGLEVSKAATDYDPNKNQASAVRQAQSGDLRGYAMRAYVSAYNTGATTADLHLAEARRQTELLNKIADKDVTTGSAVSAGAQVATTDRMARALR